jgi:hypothetical protein
MLAKVNRKAGKKVPSGFIVPQCSYFLVMPAGQLKARDTFGIKQAKTKTRAQMTKLNLSPPLNPEAFDLFKKISVAQEF